MSLTACYSGTTFSLLLSGNGSCRECKNEAFPDG